MGFVELHHHQIVEIGLALLAHSTLPKPFWEDTFLIATYIVNHLPSKSLFEMAYNKKNPTICLCVFLDVPVGQTCMLITNIKLIFDLKLIFFLVIVYHTRATNVSTFPQVNYMSHAMSFIMSLCFHTTKSPLNQILPNQQLFPYHHPYVHQVVTLTM